MNKIVNKIMDEQLHRYGIEIYLISGIVIKVDCCKCFFAYDPETCELEIHEDTEEERENLVNPVLKIKEEDIIAWS